jgi:hypothetical protein
MGLQLRVVHESGMTMMYMPFQEIDLPKFMATIRKLGPASLLVRSRVSLFTPSNQ